MLRHSYGLSSCFALNTLPLSQLGGLPVIAALTQILVFQLVGEIIAHHFNLPVPGPVLGMLLLFAFLVLNQGPSHQLHDTGQQLLKHLSLLFVPAGTGIMVHLHRLQSEWFPLVMSLVLSTALALAATAGVMLLLGKRQARAREEA